MRLFVRHELDNGRLRRGSRAVRLYGPDAPWKYGRTSPIGDANFWSEIRALQGCSVLKYYAMREAVSSRLQVPLGLLDRLANKHEIFLGADVVIGNPPFLGGVKIRGALGDAEYERLRLVYETRVPASADFVTYWFVNSSSLIDAGRLKRAGLVATNSIRGGGSRFALEHICSTGMIFDAWSDQEWTIEGAAVRVSIVCFAGKSDAECLSIRLNGEKVKIVFPDLTSGATDLTKAVRLPENVGVAFQGSKKVGPFEVSGEIARKWLTAPINPNGRPNSDVLKLSWIAIDVVRFPRDAWIVDFGLSMNDTDAALYEAPFSRIVQYVRPLREENKRESRKRNWWRHGDGQPRNARSNFQLVPVHCHS
jgi:type II restriction/modification system DNA methylase subunit YeeA